MNNENALVQQLNKEGIEQSTQLELKNAFLPYFEQAEIMRQEAESIVITSLEQKEDMKQARSMRLALKNIRVEVEKKRKELKEESLRKGKAIDGIANVVKYLIVPIEEHLKQQEKFIEIQEAKQKEALKIERIETLKPYFETEEEIGFYQLGEMDQASFDRLLKNSVDNYNARIESQKRIEQERIEKEEAERKEREKIRLENEQLKQLAEARQQRERIGKDRQTKLFAIKVACDFDELCKMSEVEFKKLYTQKSKEFQAEQARLIEEKRLQDEQLAKERAEKARIESELKAKQESEIKEQERIVKEKAEKEAAEKAKLLAPDKDKLSELASTLNSIQYPILNSNEANILLDYVKVLVGKVVKHINDKSQSL